MQMQIQIQASKSSVSVRKESNLSLIPEERKAMSTEKVDSNDSKDLSRILCGISEQDD